MNPTEHRRTPSAARQASPPTAKRCAEHELDLSTVVHQAGLAQLGERQTEVHFNHKSEGHVFDPHKPHVSIFAGLLGVSDSIVVGMASCLVFF